MRQRVEKGRKKGKKVMGKGVMEAPVKAKDDGEKRKEEWESKYNEEETP